MGVSLRHFSPSSFWISRRPRVSSSILSFLVPRRRILSRTLAITNGNAGYSTATASGGFQHSGHQQSSTVEFNEEWKLGLGSKTARMVPVKQDEAVSAWRKEEVNKFRERNGELAKNLDDAIGNGSYYFRGVVPKVDDVQSSENCQNLDYKLKPRVDITSLDRELNGFMQSKTLREPNIALPSKNIEVAEKIDDGASYKNTGTISKVEKCSELSKIRANLGKIYNRVCVVDNVSAAKEIVSKLINQYRNLVHACDTEYL